jgi:hypothetical protein
VPCADGQHGNIQFIVERYRWVRQRKAHTRRMLDCDRIYCPAMRAMRSKHDRIGVEESPRTEVARRPYLQIEFDDGVKLARRCAQHRGLL